MKPLPLLALTVLIFFSAAHAGVPVPEENPEAGAAWTRMDARLSQAQTMTFTITLTGKGPKARPPLTITGQCAKPSKLTLRLRRNGIEIAEAYLDWHLLFRLNDCQG